MLRIWQSKGAALRKNTKTESSLSAGLLQSYGQLGCLSAFVGLLTVYISQIWKYTV